jgi:uncharacterized delta-60 repeat protein
MLGEERREAGWGVSIALALAVLAIFAPAALAAPADLDTSFDGDGRALPYPVSDRTNDVVVQPDGKIITVGDLSGHWAVIRLNVDGSLDMSFDAGGLAAPTFYGDESFASAYDVELQPDGKIVVAGTTDTATMGNLGGEFAVARFNPDGSLDTTFSGDGKFAFGYACTCDAGYGVAIQPDGKIIVVGTGGVNNDVVAVRLLSNGNPDASFNGNGSVGVDLGSSDTAYAVRIQSDGKVLLAGDTTPAVGFALRLTAGGALDSTFDGDGIKTLGSVSFYSAQGLAIQSDGKPVLAGYGLNALGDFMGVRLTSTGALDSSFDGDGFFALDLGDSDRAYDVTLDQSGRSVFVGYGGPDSEPSDWVVARRNTNGSADTTFNGGYRTIDFFSNYDWAYGVAVAPNGRIVVAGLARNPSVATYVGVARLLGNTPPPAPYPRPATATPTRVPLVPAYNQCTAPNSTHRAPKLSPGPGTGDPACNPPVRTSTALTTSTTGVGSGFAKLRAIVGNPGTQADEADVSVQVSATDVRCASVSSCTAGNDYPGQLILRLSMRLTDGGSDLGSATVSDTKIDVPIACTPTGGAAGSTCSLTTTLDTMVAGSAPEGKLSIYDLTSIQLFDAGADGTIGTQPCAPNCGNGDEKVYLTEGIFTP